VSGGGTGVPGSEKEKAKSRVVLSPRRSGTNVPESFAEVAAWVAGGRRTPSNPTARRMLRRAYVRGLKTNLQ
jgi:hypothetical protein